MQVQITVTSRLWTPHTLSHKLAAPYHSRSIRRRLDDHVVDTWVEVVGVVRVQNDRDGRVELWPVKCGCVVSDA